jgi:hypothetical protein
VLYLETASNRNTKKATATKNGDAWKELEKYLGLKLPQGHVSLEPSLQGAMLCRGQFDPRIYFQQMDTVLKQVKGP